MESRGRRHPGLPARFCRYDEYVEVRDILNRISAPASFERRRNSNVQDRLCQSTQERSDRGRRLDRHRQSTSTNGRMQNNANLRVTKPDDRKSSRERKVPLRFSDTNFQYSGMRKARSASVESLTSKRVDSPQRSQTSTSHIKVQKETSSQVRPRVVIDYDIYSEESFSEEENPPQETFMKRLEHNSTQIVSVGDYIRINSWGDHWDVGRIVEYDENDGEFLVKCSSKPYHEEWIAVDSTRLWPLDQQPSSPPPCDIVDDVPADENIVAKETNDDEIRAFDECGECVDLNCTADEESSQRNITDSQQIEQSVSSVATKNDESKNSTVSVCPEIIDIASDSDDRSASPSASPNKAYTEPSHSPDTLPVNNEEVVDLTADDDAENTPGSQEASDAKNECRSQEVSTTNNNSLGDMEDEAHSNRSQQEDDVLEPREFAVGDSVLARWNDGIMYPAHVTAMLPRERCSVLFLDGISKTLPKKQVRKLRSPYQRLLFQKRASQVQDVTPPTKKTRGRPRRRRKVPIRKSPEKNTDVSEEDETQDKEKEQNKESEEHLMESSKDTQVKVTLKKLKPPKTKTDVRSNLNFTDTESEEESSEWSVINIDGLESTPLSSSMLKLYEELSSRFFAMRFDESGNEEPETEVQVNDLSGGVNSSNGEEMVESPKQDNLAAEVKEVSPLAAEVKEVSPLAAEVKEVSPTEMHTEEHAINDLQSPNISAPSNHMDSASPGQEGLGDHSCSVLWDTVSQFFQRPQCSKIYVGGSARGGPRTRGGRSVRCMPTQDSLPRSGPRTRGGLQSRMQTRNSVKILSPQRSGAGNNTLEKNSHTGCDTDDLESSCAIFPDKIEYSEHELEKTESPSAIKEKSVVDSLSEDDELVCHSTDSGGGSATEDINLSQNSEVSNQSLPATIKKTGDIDTSPSAIKQKVSVRAAEYNVPEECDETESVECEVQKTETGPKFECPQAGCGKKCHKANLLKAQNHAFKLKHALDFPVVDHLENSSSPPPMHVEREHPRLRIRPGRGRFKLNLCDRRSGRKVHLKHQEEVEKKEKELKSRKEGLPSASLRVTETLKDLVKVHTLPPHYQDLLGDTRVPVVILENIQPNNSSDQLTPNESDAQNSGTKRIHTPVVSDPSESMKKPRQTAKPSHSASSHRMILCACNEDEEQESDDLVQCSDCKFWQHVRCIGFEDLSQVPRTYMCEACANKNKPRKHEYSDDQDWLSKGKLPSLSFCDTDASKKQRREDILKKSHELTGSLLELKYVIRSLWYNIHLAANPRNPNLHFWADAQNTTEDGNPGATEKEELEIFSSVCGDNNRTPQNNLEDNAEKPDDVREHIPYNTEKCQKNLMDHVERSQDTVMTVLSIIEAQVSSLECDQSNLDDVDVEEDATHVVNRAENTLELLHKISKLN